ncbi:MAG TPA: hypothetical protein VNN20_15495 [Thermodesulfobacteriota bacterium]|nr:hypothetical protein [Thermodesulfobacteriota bacterium]
MPRSKDEQFLHDWVINKVKEKYSKLYKEVQTNPGEDKNYEFKGSYPDVVFVNYGQVVLIAEVETENTINEEEVNEWKELSSLGVQLVLLVPKELQNTARDICWKNGIAAKVKIGFFDVMLNV